MMTTYTKADYDADTERILNEIKEISAKAKAFDVFYSDEEKRKQEEKHEQLKHMAKFSADYIDNLRQVRGMVEKIETLSNYGYDVYFSDTHDSNIFDKDYLIFAVNGNTTVDCIATAMDKVISCCNNHKKIMEHYEHSMMKDNQFLTLLMEMCIVRELKPNGTTIDLRDAARMMMAISIFLIEKKCKQREINAYTYRKTTWIGKIIRSLSLKMKSGKYYV